VRDAKKNNNNGFCRYVSQKMKTKEAMPPLSPLINETGNVMAAELEQAEVLNNFFASVFQ